MTHVCDRNSSDKEKIFSIFNKQSKTTDKSCFSMNRFPAASRCFNHHSRSDGTHKTKRLKSRKERGWMKGGGKEASKSKSHRHHCCCQISKDMAHFHNCCHSGCHCPSKRDAPFPSVMPAAQEPSIITDSRLIGHQGLFNHEVKSIDIERFLSKQRKLEKSGQQVQEKSNATSGPSSTSPAPSSFSTHDLLGADTDEVMPFEKRANPSTNTHNNCLEEEKKISQGSDLTPGQRPQHQLDLSSGSVKSLSSPKHSSLDVVVIKSVKSNPVMSEKGGEAQLTPAVHRKIVKTFKKKGKTRVISTLELIPKNQESPVLQTKARGLSSSPPQLSSSHTADSFDIQHRGRDPDCVSKSVSAAAAGLCDSLHFPLLRRRSLVAESREVLMKALQERHGPQLEENLLKVQQRLSFGTDSSKEVQDLQTMADKDELLTTDAVFQAEDANHLHFDTQKTTPLKQMRRRQSSSQLHHNLTQTADWLTSPVEPSVSLLDDILRPTRTPVFCMDFGPFGVTASDHLFASSPASCWGDKASASQHWEDRFNRLKCKEAVTFGSFENSFMNRTRAATESSSGFQYSDSNTQPFFPYQGQRPHRHSAKPVHFPQEQHRFETERYSFPPSLFPQIHHPQQRNSFQPFSHLSTCPPLRPHHADMIHYPPSYMLEKDPAPPISFLPSSEDWSFPPMRLY